MTYNGIIQTPGRRIKNGVKYFDGVDLIDVSDNKIEKLKFIDKIPLVGTAMASCEITLKEKLNYDTFNNYFNASTTDESYNYYLGRYYLKEEPTYNANKKTYLYRTYDYMVKAMVPYVAVNISYPCTLYQYFKKITDAVGFINNIASLPNGSQTLNEDPYDGLNYTYRDILDDIAEANGVSFYINNDSSVSYKEIKIATLGTTAITINDDILKNKNIEFTEKYGPINTIVLSRSYETDVVYQEDQQSVAQNGRCEFKIVDNQIMNGNDRSYYIPAILNQLLGVEYYIYDVELTGFGKIDKLQKVTFNTGNNTYNSYVFNNEITQTTGYKQSFYAEKPENTNTDYTFANEVEQEIENASIMLNKKIGEVDIRGKTINMTADNIAITSTNFNVTKDGDLTCANANITGGNIVLSGVETVPKLTIINPNDNTTYSTISSGRIIGYSNGVVKSQFYTNTGLISLYASTGSHITYTGSLIQHRDSSDNITITEDALDGSINCKKIIAGNIDCGTCTLNSTTDTQVNFNKTFASAPIVILTPKIANSNPGECFNGTIVSTTTTSFTAYVLTNLNSASNISFNWIAIGN